MDREETKIVEAIETVKSVHQQVERAVEKPVEEARHWWQKVAQYVRRLWNALRGK